MSRHEQWSLGIIVAMVAILTVGKPFHIDDPVVLHVANQIIENPLDPFGGEIDWFGYLQPTWSSTTNPPLLSYYLAPFVWLTNQNDWVIHFAMLPFIVLLGWSMLELSKRFTEPSQWPMRFVLMSPAVLVSINAMRDVPALALSTAALAIYIRGVDDYRTRDMILGSVLAGLAVMTKYAAGILLPLLVLYPFLQRKWSFMVWCVPAGLILLLWCFHNWLMYGQVHVIYLALERRDDSGIPFQDKLYGAFLVLGCACYLLPAALIPWLHWRRWWAWLLTFAGVATSAWFINVYLSGQTDVEYYLWALSGCAMLLVALAVVIRVVASEPIRSLSSKRADGLFLLGWLVVPLLFAVIMVPFQAVRHLLPALPPLVLLLWMCMAESQGWRKKAVQAACILLLVVQWSVAVLVQIADTDYAQSYKTFASEVREQWTVESHETWYVGHWGWSLYATREGIRQMRIGEWPEAGDIVVRPYRADIGHVLRDDRFFFERQQILDTVEFSGTVPVRSQNFWGAGFYGVISIYGRNIPYRIGQDIFLERFTVYRVVEPHPVEP